MRITQNCHILHVISRCKVLKIYLPEAICNVHPPCRGKNLKGYSKHAQGDIPIQRFVPYL